MNIYKLELKDDQRVGRKFTKMIVAHYSMSILMDLYPEYSVVEIGAYTGDLKTPFEICRSYELI